MAISIITPQRQEAGFDKFLRRLGGVADLANSGIQSYAGVKKMRADSQQRDDDMKGVFSKKELIDKFDNAKEGDEGAMKVQTRDSKGDVVDTYQRRINTAKAKSPEEIANTEADTKYKLSQAGKNWSDAAKTKTEAGGLKSEWDKLAPPDQDLARDLSKKNASKIAIKNQIDAVMSGWDNLSDDQKVTQGRQLIKTLNSSEGADAVGSEESKRLGGKLEFAMGNLTNSNPIQFGRDLEGFKEQAMLTSGGLGNAINANQEQVRRIAGPAAGKGLIGLLKGEVNPSQDPNNPPIGARGFPEKPKTIRQNGVEYKYNEKTGDYE